ncbi:putative MYND domain protein [Rhypophila decipiens]
MASTSKSPTVEEDWKPPPAKDKPLLKCGACKSTPYCSRECQKADWRIHKNICGKPAASTKPIEKPFTRLNNGTYLHDRPEKDVFRLLIDVYRMRVEDEYKFAGNVDEDSIYSGNEGMDGTQGFRRFLKKVEQRKRNLLPDWWSDAKREECIRFGKTGGGKWSRLNRAVEKSDIIEHYDTQFPAQLRMLGEAVYGNVPWVGGASAAENGRMMQALEEKGGYLMHLSG